MSRLMFWKKRREKEKGDTDKAIRYHIIYFGDGTAGVYAVESYAPGWEMPFLQAYGDIATSHSRALLLRALRETGKRVIEDDDEWERFVYGRY